MKTVDIVVAVAGTLAAIIVSQWHRILPLLSFSRPCPAAPAGVSYQDALEALAVVRSRLAVGGKVSDEAEKAIETITLNLVKGS